MSRFLIVVPPFTGHINPIAGVAAELRGRGHEVTWVGDETVLSRTVPGNWPVHGCGAAPLAPRPPELRGFAALHHLWEKVLVPLAEWMEPTVRRAISRVRPDVVITDQQALAGALVAERAGIPWATSASTSSELVDSLGDMPKVRDWLTSLLTALRHRIGDPAAQGDPRFSPRLVIAFTTATLAGEPGRPVLFVGPVGRPPVGNGGFPLDRIDPMRATILVTMGTANTDVTGNFLRECAAALRARPWAQGVFADPGDSLLEVAGDFLRVPWLPQQALLPHASAVICHAGHNTVCESLACGVPLVLAPIRDDQPIIAEQVAAVGAGIRLRFAHARAEHIGRAADQVLTEPSFAAAAGRVRDSFDTAGGAPAAADALEKLAG
ncbi:MAG TPA: glycosyltransferase [Pseudonocardiaceae bacterium]|jgi:UDP:flavonoid glycosyltransferase YjiC (YdhE family)|nr:glycosyltransferase [Pseudonocardiaceae bacterium]